MRASGWRKNTLGRESRKRVAYLDYIYSVETDKEEEDQESFVAVVELQVRPSYVCPLLKPTRGKEKYPLTLKLMLST